MSLLVRLLAFFALLSSALLPAQGAAPVAPRFPEALFPELREVLAAALEQAPEVVLQRWRIEEAAGRRVSASSARLPRIDAFSRIAGQVEERDDLDSLNTTSGVTSNLVLTQPLYAWGGIAAQKTIGELQLEIARGDLRNLRTRLLAEVRDTYLRLLLERARRDLRAEGAERSRADVVRQERLLDLGRGSEQELLFSRIALSQEEEGVLAADRQVALLEDRLVDISGWQGDPRGLGLVSFPAFEPATEVGLAALDDGLDGVEAGDLDPGVRNLGRLQELEEANLVLIRSRQRPRLDFVAGLFQDQIDVPDEDETILRVAAFGGVQITWNIFDGLRTQGEKRSSRARISRLEVESAVAERRWDEANRRLFRDLELNRAQILTRDQRLALSQDRLDLRERQAERGELPLNELQRERLAHAQLRLAALEARAFYLLNAAALEGRLGRDPFLPATDS